jgi:hypothetical protein
LPGGVSHNITVRCFVGWPYVPAHHLRPCKISMMTLNSTRPRVRFYETQLYAEGIEGKFYHFIYLNKDEVVDKVLKQPTTPTKHEQTQTSIIKQAMTNTTFLLTRVTPNDYEIQRGSGCPQETPRLNPGLWRWQTRCLCRMRRGR